MLRHVLYLALAGLFVCCDDTDRVLYKFRRTMEATGVRYYKMSMILGQGASAERKLYTESKIWANVRMNRILDIYYKSSDPAILVSKVEVKIILNNTDVYGRSEKGVGFSEFSGFIVLPVRSGIVLYTLNIYTVSNNTYTTKSYKTVTLPSFTTKIDSSDEESNDEENDLEI